MSSTGGAVSAFAAYSGLEGNLSKKQRRRRNKKKKDNMSVVPSDLEKTNEKLPVPESIDGMKKRKKEEVKENNSPKSKKRKLDMDPDKLNGKEPHWKSSTKKIKKSKNQKISSLKAAKAENTNKGAKMENKQKLQKSVKKVKGQIPIDQEAPYDIELLTEDQVRKKVKSDLGRNINKKFSSAKLGIKKRKVITSFKSIEENKILNLDKQRILRQLNVSSVTELVGDTQVNQENQPTLISKINKVKKDLMCEGLLEAEKPTYEKVIEHQTRRLQKMRSSADVGKEIFEKMIAPFDTTLFFRNYWEKAPLHIPARNPEKFCSLLSTQLIDDFLRRKVVMFGKHIDITSYKDGKRDTHNPEGRALPHVVWDLYNHKCSVRLLCPQAAFSNVFIMNTKLQEYFGCFVGANAYLTPPNSQGFAPHYDDIEAFVLQIEGQKRWKIYNPRNKFEVLPRYSSKNFSPSELPKPIMEVVLNPGDVLYFPRGFIHQADCSNAAHSLHLTISVYQRNSWTDLLEKAIPLALCKAAKEDVEFRRGLPLNFLQQAGLAYTTSHANRNSLIKSIKEKMTKLIKYLDIDHAVDMMGVQYITDALPPILNHEEATRSVFGNGLRMESNGKIKGNIEFVAGTKIRFTTGLCHRLIKENIKTEDGLEEEEIRLYYSLDNSLEYHGEEPQFLVVPEEYVPSIRMLSLNYPLFTAIKSLPLPTLDKQAGLVGDLWDRGILMTEEPLEEHDLIQTEEEEEEEGEGVGSEHLKEISVSKINRKSSKTIGKTKFEVAKEEDEEDDEDEKEEEEEEKEKDDEDEEEENGESDDGEINETVNVKSLREYDEAISENEKFISANDEDAEEEIPYESDSSSNSGVVSDNEEENFILTDNDEEKEIIAM